MSNNEIRFGSVSHMVTQCHTSTWKIDGFNATCANLKKGHLFSSPFFEFGGYQWSICFYPHGHYTFHNGDWSALSLRLEAVINNAVPPFPTARVNFAITHPKDRSKTVEESSTFSQGVAFSKAANVVNSIDNKFIRFEDIARKEFITADGSVTFMLQFQLMNNNCSVPPGDLRCGALNIIGKAALNGEFTDCVLELSDGTKQPAHRLILAARSPVFKAALTSRMAESSDRVIKLPAGLEASTLRQLLRHVYTGWVPSPTDPIESNEQTASELAQVIVSPRQHAAQALSLDDNEIKSPEAEQAVSGVAPPSLVLDALERPIKWTWPAALGIYRAADLYGFDELSVACLPLMKRTLNRTHLVEAALLSQRCKATESTVHVKLAAMLQEYARENAGSLLDALASCASQLSNLRQLES